RKRPGPSLRGSSGFPLSPADRVAGARRSVWVFEKLRRSLRHEPKRPGASLAGIKQRFGFSHKTGGAGVREITPVSEPRAKATGSVAAGIFGFSLEPGGPGRWRSPLGLGVRKITTGGLKSAGGDGASPAQGWATGRCFSR